MRKHVQITLYARLHIQLNKYYSVDCIKFMQLINIIDNCKSGFARSLSTRHKDIIAWINSMLPQLQDNVYNLSTKCYWILTGIEDFPKCKCCGKPLDKRNVKINFGYHDYCSTSCEVKGTGIFKRNLEKRWKKFHQQIPFYVKSPIVHNDYKNLIKQILSYMPLSCLIKWLVENRPDGCIAMLKSNNFKYLYEYIFHNTAFLDQYKPDISTRIFCIVNDILSIDDSRLKCKTCGKFLIGKPCSMLNGFQKYCSTSCIAKNKDLKKLKRATHFNKYRCHRQIPETNYKKQLTCLKHYGSTHWNSRIYDYDNATDELKFNRQKSWNKYISTLISKRGYKNYGCSHKCDAECKEMFVFNVFNYNAEQQFKKSSKEENECFYMLRFLYPHLIRQFKSIEYPFKCDFYDPDTKAYIEYNGSWMHGKHFYNPFNKDDIQKATSWKNSSHTTYQNAYITWTIRDVKKVKYAENNKLKYLVFWNLDEARKYVLDELQKHA